MKKILAVLFLFFLLGFFNTASAYVDTWGFDLQYGFLNDYTPHNGVTASDLNYDYGYKPTRLSWGDPAPNPSGPSGQSSIFVEDYSLQGTIYTNAATSTSGATLWHQNYPIYGTSLETATLSSKLTLTANSGEVPPLEKEFYIDFLETTNPAGDIFLITGFENFIFTFYYDQWYTLSFHVDGFGDITDQLTPAQKYALGLDSNEKAWGFITDEGKATDFTTSFSITGSPDNPVPEPSTIVLFGIGLLCLAVVGKRKIQNIVN